MIITPDELHTLLGAAYHDGIAAEAAQQVARETRKPADLVPRLTRQLIICAHILAQNPALKRRAAGDLAQLEHAAKRLEAAMKGTP